MLVPEESEVCVGHRFLSGRFSPGDEAEGVCASATPLSWCGDLNVEEFQILTFLVLCDFAFDNCDF